MEVNDNILGVRKCIINKKINNKITPPIYEIEESYKVYLDTQKPIKLKFEVFSYDEWLKQFKKTLTISDYLIKQFNSKLNDLFIEGLKRKGFEFKNKTEIESFIKERCRCEDNTNLKERVYYINDLPFFLHNYKTEIITDPSITGDKNTIIGNLGTYRFL